MAEEDTLVQQTNALPMPDEEGRRHGRAGAITPPYPPAWLAMTYEQSTALRPAVEALEAMVDGSGHRFEPKFDTKKPDARQTVEDSIMLERLDNIGGLRRANPNASLIPTKMDVDMRIAEIEVRMRLEKLRLEALFSACCPGSTFIKLRKKLRRDYEVTGNAYLGVRRDNWGDVAEFEYLPSVAMRLCPQVSHHGRPLWVPVQVPVRRTPITVEYVTSHRAFRTFVQYGLTTNVYFKEFGDPRVFSARDGRMVDSVEDLLPGEPAATEVIHLKIDSALYEYGVPRWIAAAPSIAGLRASQEVNAAHFDNNAIPRMMFLISGGVLKEGAEKKLEDILRRHAKGRENYGAAVIIQATPASNNPTARVTIEAKSLKEAVPDDMLFEKFGARCRDEVLSQFRLPEFAVGILRDVNRASATEGMQAVEDQVYNPLRVDFDGSMEPVLDEMGILYWRYVSNSPVSRDPEVASDVLEKITRAGGASINDARRQAAEIHNIPFVPAPPEWGELPLELAKLVFKPVPATAPAMDSVSKSLTHVSTPHDLAEFLVKARDSLARGERESFAAEARTQHGSTLMLPLSGDEIAELVDFA